MWPYPSGSSGVKLRLGLCWRCCFAGRLCCPFAPVRGVVVHAQLARRYCSVAIVAVAVRSSCVSVVLLMDNYVTACLSAAFAVAKFASTSACCCCISSLSAALACPPLMMFVPYPSDSDVRGWTLISLNSLAKKILKASQVFYAVSFWCHTLTPS